MMAVSLLFASTGCKKAATTSPSQHINFSQIDPATAGTVSGTISWKGKAPERLKIDMSQDPACSMSGGDNYAEQFMVHDGKLANVFLYVKDGLGNKVYAAPTVPVVLDQKGCRYVPHVLGVMVGQQVEFRNSDPTMHNIHMEPTIAGNSLVDISQPPMGGTERHAFARPELMIPVRCNNHPWMNAFVNVASNPFYAVSDGSGHFEIQGLPPGTYTIGAVQEKLGGQTMTVTVKSHEDVTANFTFAMK
jgi:plastocyanin